MRRALLLTALLLGAAPSGSAVARQVAPPGNSGVDQYLETIPDGGGGRPTNTLVGGAGKSVLAPSAVGELRASGAGGQALAKFAAATAPPRAGDHRAATTPPGARDHGSTPGQSPLSASVGALTDSGASSVGLFLPLALALSLLGAIAYAVWNRRSA
jgi:hypothetical protein